jgi:UDP-glucose 4-epimerase
MFMKKVLITGGAGFIASSLTDALLATGNYSVVGVDNFLTGKKEFLPRHPNYTFIECDVNNLLAFEQALAGYEFDYLFHYAAVVGVIRTTENPKMVMDDITGLQQVFEYARKRRIKRIFFSSSSEVYGEPVHLPQHEYETPLNSRLPYAVVKNLGECFCKTYLQAYGLKYTILRIFNTYGTRQSEDFVVSKFIAAAISGQDIPIYGDGNQSRTFCDIDDNIEFTLRILEEELFINDVVNVGDDKLVTVNELAECIIKLTGTRSKLIKLPPLKEGDMTRRQPNNSKMRATLNRDLVPLELGIEKILTNLQVISVETAV